jgi:hypothetical protein
MCHRLIFYFSVFFLVISLLPSVDYMGDDMVGNTKWTTGDLKFATLVILLLMVDQRYEMPNCEGRELVRICQ